MRKLLAVGICLVVLLILLRSGLDQLRWPHPHATEQSPAPALVPQYRAESLPTAIVHTLTIPRSLPLTVAISPTLDRLAALAQSQDAIPFRERKAIGSINAGFFDPINQQSTSFIWIGDRWVADPRQNDRLMQNPDLAPYLGQILDRSEFRQYQCVQQLQAAIVPHSAPIPPSCQLKIAIGAGPQLLPVLTAEAEGFLDVVSGRDAIGLRQPNARSAIGLTRSGDIVWVMVAQRPEERDRSGLSLIDLAAYLDRAGVVQALNLDGGSSSSFYYRGETFYGKVNAQGERIDRAIKSALLVLRSNPSKRRLF